MRCFKIFEQFLINNIKELCYFLCDKKKWIRVIIKNGNVRFIEIFGISTVNNLSEILWNLEENNTNK